MDQNLLGSLIGVVKQIPDTAVSEAVSALEQAQEVKDSIPEDYSALSESVGDLKSQTLYITGQEMVTGWVKGKYIALNVSAGTVININNPGTSANFKYATHACTENDYFIITGTGGSASRLYGFLDASNKLLVGTAVSGESRTNYLLKAPANAAMLILNVGINESTPSWYLGKLDKALINEIGLSNQSATPNVKTATVISGNNVETSTNDYVCTDYVRVSGDADTVQLYCTVFQQVAALLFYDIRYNLLLAIDSSNASDYGISASSTTPQMVKVALPSGCCYIRANMRSTYYSTPATFSIVFYNTRSLRKTEQDNAYAITLNKIEYNSNKLNLLRSKFDDTFNWIAYSNVQSSGQSINTLEHFEWCAKKPVFKSLKADMQLTSDGEIILCHDAGFTLDGNGKVTIFDASNCTLIHDMTYAECVALQHAGTNQHVCGIDAVLKTCKKYGKHLYITLRDNYYQDTFDALLPKLRQYAMEFETIINCYPQNDAKCDYIRSKSADICIGYTCTSNAALFAKAVDRCDKLGNCIVTPFIFSTGPVDIVNTLSTIQTSINKAKDKGLRVYVAIIYQDNATDALMECGVTGAQTYITPTDIDV